MAAIYGVVIFRCVEWGANFGLASGHERATNTKNVFDLQKV